MRKTEEECPGGLFKYPLMGDFDQWGKSIQTGVLHLLQRRPQLGQRAATCQEEIHVWGQVCNTCSCTFLAFLEGHLGGGGQRVSSTCLGQVFVIDEISGIPLGFLSSYDSLMH